MALLYPILPPPTSASSRGTRSSAWTDQPLFYDAAEQGVDLALDVMNRVASAGMKGFSRSAFALMAHPDDIEFLCAGTLIHLARRGWKVHLATMTAGDCGTKTQAPDELRRIRSAEAARAARLIGATYDCLGENDFMVAHSVPLLRKVVELVRRYNPSLVFTHPPADYMTDHEGCSTAVRMACFSAGAPNFLTHVPSPALATEHVPHLFYADAIEGIDIFGNPTPVGFCVDVSEVMSLKTRMLACHVSQRLWLKQHHRLDNYLRSMKDWSAKRGRDCGIRHAEGFRQHLGQGYPRDNPLRKLLGSRIRLPSAA